MKHLWSRNLDPGVHFLYGPPGEGIYMPLPCLLTLFTVWASCEKPVTNHSALMPNLLSSFLASDSFHHGWQGWGGRASFSWLVTLAFLEINSFSVLTSGFQKAMSLCIIPDGALSSWDFLLWSWSRNHQILQLYTVSWRDSSFKKIGFFKPS